MVKNHMKRIAAPKTWKVLRKTTKFITNPSPGAHKKSMALSINTFLKDETGLAKTTKESKFLLTKKEVLINGKRKRDHKTQAGFLDIITLPHIKKSYRITVSDKGKLKSKEITEAESKETIVRIRGKTLLVKGKMQINTMDGKSMLVKKEEAKAFKVGDSILVSIPEYKIKEHLPREKGAHAIIFTGKHAGKTGEILEMEGNLIKIKTNKETFETKKDYALVTGKNKPAIDVE